MLLGGSTGEGAGSASNAVLSPDHLGSSVISIVLFLSLSHAHIHPHAHTRWLKYMITEVEGC